MNANESKKFTLHHMHELYAVYSKHTATFVLSFEWNEFKNILFKNSSVSAFHNKLQLYLSFVLFFPSLHWVLILYD